MSWQWQCKYTGELNPDAFALESVAGAYWRGDETQAQLQRIYGTAWETPEQSSLLILTITAVVVGRCGTILHGSRLNANFDSQGITQKILGYGNKP